MSRTPLPVFVKKTEKIKRIHIVLPAVLITLIIFSFLFLNTIISAIIHKKGDVTVPDISGKTLLEALDILSQKNLGLKKEGAQYSDNVPPNTVIKQTPRPGMNTRPGRMVRVIVSYGGQFVFVPSLVGLPIRTAEIEIRKNGLALGEETMMYSYSVAEGLVISQEPLPGTVIDKTSLVNMAISIGPPPPGTILMPNFIGRNIKEAENWVTKTGRQIEEKKLIQSKILDDGTIMKQSPSVDTILEPGTQIKLIITAKDTAGEINQKEENR